MRKRGLGVWVFLCAALVAACGDDNEGGDGGDADASAPECTTNEECKRPEDFCVVRFCEEGACKVEDANEGVECDDGDLCTENDICQAGECVSDPVDCAGASDTCNTGVCNPDNGECEPSPLADDTPCNDALFCTEGDTCQSGVCQGTPRDCSAEDSDCTMGTCNEDLSACEAVAINEGGSCDDGLFCTTGETCTAGTCSGDPLDCSSATDQCNTGVCDEDADACVGDPLTDGTPCSDGLFCTPTDQCIDGTCTGSGTIDCTGLDNQCNVGVCDEDEDGCAPAPANEGGACSDGLFCTENETCTSGVCGGGSAIDCGDGNSCTTDTCDDVANACVNTNVPIPGAEGPPGDATCSDGEDNDCDGLDDLNDPNCVGCTNAGDCDDGNDCTEDVCNGSSVCENNPLTGTTCDDGLFCTESDECTAGVCGGSPRDCSAEDDDCNVGTCDETGDACVPQPANEGGGCADGLFCTVGDTCSDGVCSGAPRDCSGAGGPCATGTCDEDANACVGEPVGDGTSCDISFCQVGGTCTGGNCTGTGPRDCGDADTCTSDACNDVIDTCENDPLQIDPDSPVFTSATGDVLDVCLTAGSGARVVVWTDVVDTVGAPIPGATVTIGGFAATESSARPGTYFIELQAAGAPTTETLDISVTSCGDVETLTSSVAVTHLSANTTLNGTGGCSPMGGNLRLRVVDEDSAPVAGANVLIGDAEADVFETNPESLFGGASTLVTNTATTDANGFASFFDYGSALSSPVTSTAGAADRAYVTVVDADAADIVVTAPLINPTPPSTSVYGDGTGAPAPPFCDRLDAGVVLPHLDIDILGSFDTSKLFGANRCWDSMDATAGIVAVPENVWIPAQQIGVNIFGSCVGADVVEATWSLELDNTADTGITQDLNLVYADAPLDDVLDILDDPDASIADLLPVLSFRLIGFDLDVNVAGDVSPYSLTAADDYPAEVNITYAGAPFETDVVGVNVGDYDGTNGIGPLFLLGTDIRPFTPGGGGGTQVALPNSDLGETSSPMGVRRASGLVALYLDPEDPNRTVAVPAALADGATAIYVRDDGMGNPPYAGADASFAIDDISLSPFLDIAAANVSGPATFTWENASNAGNIPLYSVHELALVTNEFLPVLSCQSENEVREQRTVQWIVIKPFDANCGPDECFDLPTLPASFPRAATATQKRSGFEQRVGSGAACGSCGVAGEACVDPDGAGAATDQCMGGSGSAADPFFTQDYVWFLHVYNLELLPDAFDFNAYDFDVRRLYMTHESTNQIDFN